MDRRVTKRAHRRVIFAAIARREWPLQGWANSCPHSFSRSASFSAVDACGSRLLGATSATKQRTQADQADCRSRALSIGDSCNAKGGAERASRRRQRLESGEMGFECRTNSAGRRSFGICRGEHAREADHIGADGAVSFMFEDDRVMACHHAQPFDSLIPASLKIRFSRPVPTSFFV